MASDGEGSYQVLLRQHTPKVFLAVALTLTLLHLVENPLYQYIESKLWNIRYTAANALAPRIDNKDLVVITVDESSLKSIPAVWPWNRKIMAKAINELSAAKAKTVGLFFYYGRPSFENKEQDQVLAKALEKNGRTVLLSSIDFESGNLSPPARVFREAALDSGYSLFQRDESGQVTKVRYNGFTKDKAMSSWPSSLLKWHLGIKSFNIVPKERSVELKASPEQGWETITIPINADGYSFVNQRHLSELKVFPFYRLYKGTIPKEALENKLVLIGARARSIGASQKTPIHGERGGVELMAAFLSSCLNHDLIYKPPFYLIALLLSSLAVAATLLGYYGDTRIQVIGFTAALLLLLLLPPLAFALGGIILPQFRPLALLVLLFIAGIVRHRYRPFIGVAEVSDAAVEMGAQRALNLGLKLMEAGRIEDSLKYFQKVANLRSTRASEGQYYMALVLMKKGSVEVAANLISQIDVDNLEPEKAYTLAEELEKQGELDTARTLYEHVFVANTAFRDVGTKLEGVRNKLARVDESDVANMVAKRVIDSRYKEIEVIGHGGMGFVFKAIDSKRENRPVAIKVMSPLYANEKGVYKRFIREAQGIASFDTPGLIKIYDVFQANLPYYSMEFLDGWKEMAEVLMSKGRFSVEETLQIAKQVCQALGSAHSASIVHRDIKPQNIMLDKDFNAKILDFGIAKFDEMTELTATGARLGTPLYMSPEQVKGYEVSVRSDIYSLAIVFYQMLVGSPPFKEMSDHVTKKVPEAPSGLGLPKSLVSVIEKALNKDADERYSSMEEFGKALEDSCKTRLAT